MRRISVFRSLVLTLMLIVVIANMLNIPIRVYAYTHDVAVTKLQPSTGVTASILRGEDVTISVTIYHNGTFAEREEVRITVNKNTTKVAADQTLTVAQGATNTTTFIWDTDSPSYGVRKGKYLINCRLELRFYADEYMANNEKWNGTVYVTVHDIAVIDVRASPTGVSAGGSVEVNATIENVGDYTENFNVTAYYDDTLFDYASGLITLPPYMMIEDCEPPTPWSNVTGNAKASLDTIDKKERTASAKIEVNASFTTGLAANKSLTTTRNLENATEIALWAKSNVSTSSGDLGLHLEEGAVVKEDLSFPALVSDTWTFLILTLANPAGDTTIDAVGLDVRTDLGKQTIWLDEIHQYNKHNETFTWNTGGVANGNYEITANATIVTDEAVNDRSDNTFIDGTVNIPAIHDRAVTSVSATPTLVQLGTSVTITVKVENQGDFDETFDVTPYYGSTPAATAQSASLSKRAHTGEDYKSSTLTFSWDTTSIAFGNYTIKAVAVAHPEETDTADNTYINGKVITPCIYMDPDKTTGLVGQAFAVQVNVGYVPDCFSWQVRFFWDPSVLEYVYVFEGDFLMGNPYFVWGSRPASYYTDALTIDNPTNAYDQVEGTYASFNYSQADDSFRVGNFTKEPWGTAEAPFSIIKKVDFNMRYSAAASSLGDRYRITYKTLAGTTVVLQDWTSDAASLDTRVWADQAEPDDGAWVWDDIAGLRFMVETDLVGGDTAAEFRVYEAWVSVSYERVRKFLFSVNKASGYCTFGSSTIHDYPGVTGGGWLATIGLRVVGSGECDLTTEHSYTYLQDSGLAYLPRTTVSGHHYEPDPEDLNGDGIIDIFDLAVVGLNYGRYVTQQNDPTTWAGAGAGAWTNPQYAASSDDYYATAVVKNYAEDYGDYGFDITGWTGVAKVEVGVELKIAAGGNDKLYVFVSPDGGTSWSDPEHTVIPTESDTLVWIDVTDDFAWTPSMLTDGNFMVEIKYIVVGGSGTLTISVDWLPVKVYPEPLAMHPEADVNGSGKVDIWDLTLIAIKYGKEVGT